MVWAWITIPWCGNWSDWHTFWNIRHNRTSNILVHLHNDSKREPAHSRFISLLWIPFGMHTFFVTPTEIWTTGWSPRATSADAFSASLELCSAWTRAIGDPRFDLHCYTCTLNPCPGKSFSKPGTLSGFLLWSNFQSSLVNFPEAQLESNFTSLSSSCRMTSSKMMGDLVIIHARDAHFKRAIISWGGLV